jgi:chemotaxis protein MotB
MLKPEAERILSIIGREITTLDRPVVIEGHTDSRPYNKSDGYTNWELSADRANAARRQMVRTGLKHSLVRAVRGLADRDLANPDPLDPRNRRVSILVVAHVSDFDAGAGDPGAGGEAAGHAPEPASHAADKPRH